LKKAAPGCLISDCRGFGIHFASDETSDKSISSHLPDGSSPQELLASGGTEERQDTFSFGQQIYLRLCTEGKISLGVVPSRPPISRPLISLNARQLGILSKWLRILHASSERIGPGG
jgi:hypothetical protein